MKIIKEAATDGKLYKSFELEEKAAIDKENRTVEVVVSSESRDRAGDRVIQKGIDHSHSKSVLWGHNYGKDGQLPIAKIIDHRISKKDGTKVTIEKHQFPAEGKHQLSDDVWNLIQEGIVNSTSIGFIPMKVKEPVSDEERKELDLGPYGVLYEAVEKLETSWVPVPANREAVLNAHQKGIIKSDLSDLFPFGEPITKDLVEKPYENEHACRLKDPGQYDRFARKNCEQKADGKCIDVIYGIKAGKSEIQALRYPKDAWTASAARSHCKSHDGTFEAAARCVDDLEQSLSELKKDIRTLNIHVTDSFMCAQTERDSLNERLEAVEKSAIGKKPEIDDNALGEALQGMVRDPKPGEVETAVANAVRNVLARTTEEMVKQKLGIIDPSKLKFRKREY